MDQLGKVANPARGELNRGNYFVLFTVLVRISLLIIRTPKTESGMYDGMVSTFSRVWINRTRLPILLVVSSNGEKMFFFPPCSRSHLRIWSRDRFGRPRQPPLIFHTQLNHRSDANSRNSSRFPTRRPHIYIYRQPPSGQFRVYRVAQLRTHVHR